MINSHLEYRNPSVLQGFTGVILGSSLNPFFAPLHPCSDFSRTQWKTCKGCQLIALHGLQLKSAGSLTSEELGPACGVPCLTTNPRLPCTAAGSDRGIGSSVSGSAPSDWPEAAISVASGNLTVPKAEKAGWLLPGRDSKPKRSLKLGSWTWFSTSGCMSFARWNSCRSQQRMA